MRVRVQVWLQAMNAMNCTRRTHNLAPNADHTGEGGRPLKLQLTHDLTGRGRFTLRCPKVLLGALLMIGAPGIDIGGGSWSAMRDDLGYATKCPVQRRWWHEYYGGPLMWDEISGRQG